MRYPGQVRHGFAGAGWQEDEAERVKYRRYLQKVERQRMGRYVRKTDIHND